MRKVQVWALRGAVAVVAGTASACGFSFGSSPSPASTASPSASATTSATPSASPTNLFSSGASPAGAPSSSPSAPVLDITQLSFHMSFAAQLGSISYALQNVNQTGTDAQGRQYTLTTDISLVTGDYLAQCGSGSVEGIVEVYTTTASSLDFSNQPAQPTDPHPQWVRVGQYLIDFQPPQNIPCAEGRAQSDIALLKQMVTTATTD